MLETSTSVPVTMTTCRPGSAGGGSTVAFLAFSKISSILAAGSTSGIRGVIPLHRPNKRLNMSHFHALAALEVARAVRDARDAAARLTC